MPDANMEGWGPVAGEDLAGRFTIGPTSPAYWAEVIDMQRRRLQRGLAAHEARAPHPDRRDEEDGFRDSFLDDGLGSADFLDGVVTGERSGSGHLGE